MYRREPRWYFMKLFKRLFVILFALSAASCAKISYNPTEVSGISLNRSEITMEVSNTFQLEAYNEPSKVSNKNVSWTVSSGSTIVSVSSTGLIRALKTGSAKVTATEKEKGYTATCNITVSKKTKVDKKKIFIIVGIVLVILIVVGILIWKK